MKYCPRCGTQLSDNFVVCPQCQTPINHNPISNQAVQTSNNNCVTQPPKTSNKVVPLIIINIILTTLVLIVLIISYFIPSPNSNSINNGDSANDDSIPSDTIGSDCPANEYGNHNWSRATCQKPSYCYDCYKEKNDKLGNHSWDTDEDGNRYCWDCGIPYDDYISSEE